MRFKDTIGISHLITGVENKMRIVLDAALEDIGMSLAQYSALSALEVQQPLTNADIARACGVTPQTMNRIMSALTIAKLVTKIESEEHGLKVNYALSSLALKRLCLAHEVVHKIEKLSLKGVTAADLKNLQSSLILMQSNLKALCRR